MGPMVVDPSWVVVVDVVMVGFVSSLVGVGDRMVGTVPVAAEASAEEGRLSSDMARHAECKNQSSQTDSRNPPNPIKGLCTGSGRLRQGGGDSHRGRPGNGIHVGDGIPRATLAPEEGRDGGYCGGVLGGGAATVMCV
jgi:hypothetical protein